MSVARREAWGLMALQESQQNALFIESYSDERLHAARSLMQSFSQEKSRPKEIDLEDEYSALNNLLSRPIQIPQFESQDGTDRTDDNTTVQRIIFDDSPNIKFVAGRTRRFAAAQALELLTGYEKRTSQYSRFVLDPNGPYAGPLEFLNLLACLYTLIAEPYLLGLAHYTSGSDWKSSAPGGLVFFSGFCDIFFLFDFIVGHFKGFVYYTAGKQKKTELRPSKTIQRYWSTWFILDALTSVPVQLVVYANNHSFTMVDGLFVMSVLKLLKTFRFSDGLDKLKGRLSWSFFVLLQCFIIVVLTAHFIACFWLIVIAQTAITANPDVCSDRKELMATKDASVQYSCALSWAVATGTTVGIGDIHPQSRTERTFAAISSFVLGAIFFYNLVHLFARRSDLEQGLQLEMLQALQYSREKKFSTAFLEDVKWFYNEKHRLGIVGNASLKSIPPFAKVASFLELHARHVSLIEFLSVKETSDIEFWEYFLDLCENRFYLPKDWLQRQDDCVGRLFILLRGEAKEIFEPSGHVFRVHDAGGWFCDRRALPERPFGKVTSGVQVTGTELCETLELSVEGLHRMRQDYPEVYDKFEPACRAKQNNLGRSVWTRVWSAHKGEILEIAGQQRAREAFERTASAQSADQGPPPPSHITRLPSVLNSDDED